MTESKLVEGEDYYFDPDGKFVLTAKYLKKRGHCCKNGCRHCPYGFDGVRPRTRPKKGR